MNTERRELVEALLGPMTDAEYEENERTTADAARASLAALPAGMRFIRRFDGVRSWLARGTARITDILLGG
jgi:hypothetical protein